MLFLIFVAPALVIWQMLRDPRKTFRRCYAGLSIRETPQPGDVFFEFHTYDGVVVYVRQTPHAGFGTYDDVREVLRRLHRFNLVHGLICPGAIFIPLLSIGNYRGQLSAIRRQCDQGGYVCVAANPNITTSTNMCPMCSEVVPTGSATCSACGEVLKAAPPLVIRPSWVSRVFYRTFGGLAWFLCGVFMVGGVGASFMAISEKKYGEAVAAPVISVIIGLVIRSHAKNFLSKARGTMREP